MAAVRTCLFPNTEQMAQDPTEHLRRLPDYNRHDPFSLLPSAAGAAAGNQQKSHEKKQSAHRKDRSNQDADSQRHRADSQQAGASPEHCNHALSNPVYTAASKKETAAAGIFSLEKTTEGADLVRPLLPLNI